MRFKKDKSREGVRGGVTMRFKKDKSRERVEEELP